jgi:hypothetical protein
MADLNFPNPGVQTTYTFVGKTWNWDGQRWAFASSGSGITKLNDLTASVQNFLIGYTGPFPNIVSSGSDHTFNIPIAGIAATGLVSTLAQSFAGAKTFTSTVNPTFIGQGGVIVHGGIGISGNAAIGGSAIFTNRTNTNTISFYAGVQGSTLAYILPIDTPTAGQVLSASAPSSGVVTLSWEDDQTGAPAGGITQLNGLAAATQSFQTGTAGVDFGISSTTSTHTFNLPDASATARGVITTGTQTIAGAKTFSSSIVGNLTGTATTSENVNVTTTTRSLTHYLTFTNQTSGSGLGLTTSAVGIGFTVNPAQNTLAAGTFIGNLSGTAATATNFYGTLVGNSSTATTSQNVNVNTTTAGGSFFLTFTNQSSGSGLALTTSTVGIGFTVNPAQNTLAAGTFIGNLSGTAATATNFYGTHIGNVTGTATTSQNVNVTTTTAGGNFYLTFTNQSSGSGLALTTSAIGIGFTVNPAQNTLAAGTFIGNLSGTAATATNFYGTHIGNVTGTATTSQNLNTVAATTGTGHYLLFSPVNGASGVAVSSDAQLQFSPATNVLTADIFNGNLTATGATVTSILDVQGDAALGNATGDTVTFNARIGSHFNPSANTTYDLGLPTLRWRNVYLDYITGTAVTATNFYGSLTGTATTAQNVNVNTTTAGGSFFLTFTNQSSGSGLALTTSTIGIGFTVNPAQNTLAAGTFIGNLSGIAATATNFYGTHIGNVTGTATTSQNVNVTTTTAGGSFYLTFTNQSSGSGLALTTSTIGIGFTVNPAQNTLAAGTFIGNLSGTAATATNFYGTHIGNVTGTATTSQNVNVTTTTRSTDHYLLFTNASSGSGLALTTSTVGMGLTYNPATNTLSAQFFTGTATTARNVDVTSTTINSTHYLTFTNATSGSGLALTTSTVGVGLTYNPAQNTLGAGTFVGNVSGAATTSTYITGILRNASYVQGDLLAGASTGNTLTRLPVGATNRYFLKPDSTTQSGLGWSTFAGVFVTSLAPASPAFTLLEGDLWYKVDDGSFNVYYTDVDETAQWVEIVSAGAGGGGGAGAAGGSAFEVQYNSGGVLDGDPNLVWGPSTPSLTLKGFPVDAQTGCALQILGPAKTITASTGTFLGINSASGYSGKMIDVQNNDSVKFSVASDGATTIATLVSNGAVYSNGGTLTNSNPSDQNLKENIQSMIGGTTIVNQLNPVSFEWKSGVGGTGTKYGFIAQEVQAIIPDIVSTDSSGTIGIDTVSIIPFLVKSIKEQQETIEKLRAEIKFIKTELGI